MNEEEKKAIKVINKRTERLLEELKIEKEDFSDEPKIAYLMQEIRANKIVLNLIEKQQRELDKDKRIKELMGEFLFYNYYKMTYVDELQFKERVKEIIEYFTKKASD